MLRFIPVLIALNLAACDKQATLGPDSDEIGAARTFKRQTLKDPSNWWRGDRNPVREKIAVDHLDPDVLFRGLIGLLQGGTEDERREAARVLGVFGDRRAIAPLVKKLNDPDKALREEICYALSWLEAKGEPAESELLKLRRVDPEIDVRVAAALTLGRPRDSEALSAFELGLSSKADWIRDASETELEKQEKLRLPLPENVYTSITRTNLQKMKNSFRSHTRREIRKGDTIYVELVEGFPDGIPARLHWFRFQAGPDDTDSKSSGLLLRDGATVHCLALSPDEERLASGNENGIVRIWQLGSGKAIHIFKGHVGPVLRVIFSPDGSRVASAGSDGTIRVWDLALDRLVVLVKVPATHVVDSLTISADGNTVLSSSNQGTKLVIWDCTSGERIRSCDVAHPIGTEVFATAFSDDGSRFALATADSEIVLCDGHTGIKIVATKVPSGRVFHLAFSPDGRRLAGAGQTMVVLDTTNGKEILDQEACQDMFHRGIRAVAFSRDGNMMATASSDNCVRVRDAVTGKVKLSYSARGGQVTHLALGKEGRKLVTANWDDDGIIAVWKPSL